jgi:Domain of unknown function (DUF397)
MIRDGKFRKATGSERTGCVEVAAMPQGGIGVRDSANRGGAVLNCTDQGWQRFVQAIKRGEFRLHG